MKNSQSHEYDILTYVLINDQIVLLIGNISVPGTIGATVIEEPISVDDGFDPNSPLVYNFGHKSPGFNLPLINQYVVQMADAVRDRFKDNRKAEASGVVVNTCGWIKGQGYEHLKHIAQSFEVDLVVVLEEEKLYTDLVNILIISITY